MNAIPEQYRLAGKITREVREVVKSKVKVGTTYLEAVELVEGEISSRGGKPAFPVGIGVNDVTAHYSPQEGDRSAFKETDMIKVDFGVHIDGYLTDTAVSITFNSDYETLLEAGERTLDVAVAAASRETRTGEIGREVRKEASRLGFKTIQNLTGHTIERFTVHAGKSIPNLYMPGLQSLKKGEVFAIEPFVTPGSAAGYVVDSPSQTIFSLIARKRIGEPEADRLAERIWEERRTLPFTPRWYSQEFGKGKVVPMLKRLVEKKAVRPYPALVEASGRPVAQFEHTMALADDGLVVLT